METTKPQLIEDKTDQELLDRVAKLESKIKWNSRILGIVWITIVLIEIHLLWG